MEAVCPSLWTRALLIFLMVHHGVYATCEVYYLDQPVNQITCNPSLFGLRLGCTIYHSNAKNYDINWYRIPIGVDKANPELVNVYKRTNSIYEAPGRGKIISSRFHIRSPSVSHAGVYWCQIVLKDEAGNINGSLQPSSAFLFHSPARYSTFPPCSDEDHALPQSKCATTGKVIEPPSTFSVPNIASSISTSSSGQIVTTTSSHERQTSPNSKTDSDMNELPPWGYAVIAGGGVISLIIISIILCMMLAYCQSLQKYKERNTVKGMSTTGDGTILGQNTSRHLVSPLGSEMSATRFSCHLSATKQDLLTSNYANMPHAGSQTGCASGMTISSRLIPGPFLNVTSQTATACEIADILDDQGMSLEHDHDESSSCSSSSAIEGIDHIYQSIHPKRPHNDKSTSSASSRQKMPSGRDQRSHTHHAPGSLGLALAIPKSPPPKLWNSPKSTMSHRKLPPIPTSQSVSNVSSSSGIATMDTTRRGSPSTVVELNQSAVSGCHGSTACQAMNSETTDRVILSSPQMNAATS